MLDQAARYFPILRVLKQHRLHTSNSILEIGAGPVGLGQFRPHPFVGCDLLYPSEPRPPLLPIIASGMALPFLDNSFDAVIVSDVLEHVPETGREAVIKESLRVTREVAIFGFPCGGAAEACDRDLFQLHRRKHREPPVWLKEHMLAPFPGASLLNSNNVPGWQVTSFGNENVRFHSWMMRMEMHRYFNYAMKACILLVPRLLDLILRWMDSPPYYRQIITLKKVAS